MPSCMLPTSSTMASMPKIASPTILTPALYRILPCLKPCTNPCILPCLFFVIDCYRYVARYNDASRRHIMIAILFRVCLSIGGCVDGCFINYSLSFDLGPSSAFRRLDRVIRYTHLAEEARCVPLLPLVSGALRLQRLGCTPRPLFIGFFN